MRSKLWIYPLAKLLDLVSVFSVISASNLLHDSVSYFTILVFALKEALPELCFETLSILNSQVLLQIPRL